MLFRIGVFGAGGVGKSTLTIRYVYNRFVTEYEPSIMNSFRKNVAIDSKPYLLDIQDTAGVDEFAHTHKAFMRSVPCCVFMYAVNDRRSFDKLGKYYLRTVAARGSNPFACVLAGNKCDLDVKRQVSVEDAEELAERYNAPFFETSAKTNTNVTEMFAECVRQINLQPDIPPARESSIRPGRRRKDRNCVLM